VDLMLPSDVMTKGMMDYSPMAIGNGGLNYQFRKWSKVSLDDDDNETKIPKLETEKIKFMPFYVQSEWAPFIACKMVTINILLMTGATGMGQNMIVIEDEGSTLVLWSKVPTVMVQQNLKTLHANVPEEKWDADFYLWLTALNGTVNAMRVDAMGKDIVAVARIPLKFPCEKKYQKEEKRDRTGTCMIYIMLEAVGSDEEENDGKYFELPEEE